MYWAIQLFLCYGLLSIFQLSLFVWPTSLSHPLILCRWELPHCPVHFLSLLLSALISLQPRQPALIWGWLLVEKQPRLNYVHISKNKQTNNKTKQKKQWSNHWRGMPFILFRTHAYTESDPGHIKAANCWLIINQSNLQAWLHEVCGDKHSFNNSQMSTLSPIFSLCAS